MSKTKSIIISFRPGSRISSKVDPASVASELEKLLMENSHQVLDPVEVVEAARDEKSPLHDAFEWNDGKAAEEYRTSQARSLIRSLIIERGDSVPRQIYVHVTNHETTGYRSVDVVVRHNDWFQSALQELVSDLSAASRAVDNLRSAAESTRQTKRVSGVQKIRKPLAAALKAAARVK